MPSSTISPESRRFLSQRSRLHYLDWGNPSASTLLLIHGGRDSCRTWDWTAAALAKDWHVVVPDLRGHGDSAWSADGIYPMAGFLLDLANLVESLGGEPVAIMGHSLGGNIALRYAGSFPDRVAKLVAIEGMGPSTATLRRLELPAGAQLRAWIADRRALATRRPRGYASIAEARDRMMEGNGHLTPDRADHLTRHGVIRQEDGSYQWKYDNNTRGFAPVDTVRPVELWQSIECPTLLVHGSKSWAMEQLSPDNLAHFRNARVAMVEGAGHWPHHDCEPAFLDTVRGFL